MRRMSQRKEQRNQVYASELLTDGAQLHGLPLRNGMEKYLNKLSV